MAKLDLSDLECKHGNVLYFYIANKQKDKTNILSLFAAQ